MSYEVIAAIMAHLDDLDLLVRRHLRPASELVQMIADAGVRGSAPVVTYFQSGMFAALAALAAIAAAQADVRDYHFNVGE